MKLLSYTIIGAFLLISCSGDSEEDLQDVPDNGGMPVSEVPLTFEKDISTLIEGRCSKCHGTTPRFGAPASAIFVTFDQVNANADRMLARMSNGTMPPASEGALSASFISAFEQWIDDGKLEK